MKNFRLWFIFVCCISAVFIGVFFLTGLFFIFCVRLGLISVVVPVPWHPLVGFVFAAAVISFGLILLISKIFFVPIQDLTAALKKVASGDFTIQLSEDSKWTEVKEMNANFNRMVKELNSTQLLQSDFIQNVSHEIKTPLAAMEGYASLLTASPLSKEQREYASRILESSRKLTALTGNILKLSKLENQQIIPEKKHFFLDEQLRLCILSMEPLWTAKNLTLDIDLQEADYLGSEELLSQVWTNLLSNAVKYTPDGGTIAIRLLKTQGDIQITFEDSGVGMTNEVMDHIFDKFYQADLSRSSGGNGLGLTLVSRILTLFGGQIFVRSQPGKGSLFTVHLPDPAIRQ